MLKAKNIIISAFLVTIVGVIFVQLWLRYGNLIVVFKGN